MKFTNFWWTTDAETKNDKIFQFLPGEKLERIFAMPGPDTFDCTVLEQNGGQVKVLTHVWGREYEEEWVSHKILLWKTGSETSKRFHAWKAEQEPHT